MIANDEPTAALPAAFRGLVARPTGIVEVAGGYVVGVIVATLLLGVVASAGVERTSGGYASEITGLVGLWVGMLGALLVARRRWRRRDDQPGQPAPDAAAERGPFAAFAADYGLRFRPIDLPIGVAAGLIAQLALVPLFELPLLPFVPHLFTRLGQPAKTLTGTASGFGLVVLGVFVCVGSPLFEEMFFRSLLMRGLFGAWRNRLGPPVVGAVCSLVVTALIFGLAHFEALQFLGLFAAGLTFGLLASSTGRLGPGIVAHATFNSLTFISLIHSASITAHP